MAAYAIVVRTTVAEERRWSSNGDFERNRVDGNA
jgi:hypothetical protein